MPKITIIIPTYNREKFVVKAIDSALNQSFKDHEIIVVDDGSKDNTKEKLKKYGDKIKYIYQDNCGVSAARNTGVKSARGEWLAFLDSDDEWMPEYLACQMIRVAKYPQIICHITNSVTVWPGGIKEDHFQGTCLLSAFTNDQFLILERPLYTIVKHSPWFLQAVIMRRDMLLTAGLFDTSLTIGEDLDVVARMALKGPFSICNKQLVCIYRREEKIENLSKIVVKEGVYSCESLARVFTQLRSLSNIKTQEKKILDKALSQNRRSLANILLTSGKKREARDHYLNALTIYPSIKSALKYFISFLPARLAVRLIRKGKNVQPGSRN